MVRKIISSVIIITFLFATAASLNSCGNSKKGYKQVKSGSGMGNKKHKNKHVWGK